MFLVLGYYDKGLGAIDELWSIGCDMKFWWWYGYDTSGILIKYHIILMYALRDGDIWEK